MTVVVSNGASEAVAEEALTSIASFVLAEMQVPVDRELSLRLVDEDEMTRLHVQYMGEPGPTDVLAFPMDEDDVDPEGAGMPDLLGDVVLCPSIAAAQGQSAGHGMQDELSLLCTHGILHLLGYDHHDPDDEREMFGLQARLITQWQQSLSGRSS